jgi:hypothetical protein
MHSKPLVGTVDFYERHAFLCHNTPENWPAKVEAPDYDPLPSKFANALRSRKNELSKKTRLTIAEGHDSPEKTNGEVLLFPDMVKYKGLGESDVESFVEEVLVKGEMWALGEPEPLVGSHVFICGHGSRDRKCGVCGPVLKDRFTEEIANRGLEDQVSVRFCSHIGGHKYAGNVIVFRHGDSGEVTGHWYGYVSPEDVPEILEKHIGLGHVIDRLWRGQMGFNEDQQKEIQQKRIADAGGVEGPKPGGCGDCACGDANEQKQPKDAKQNGVASQPTKSRKLSAVLLPRIGSRDLHQMCGDEQEEEAPLRPYEETKKSKFKWPRWIDEWEVQDTKAVLAVVGAGVAVVVAYNLYRSAAQQQ